MRVGMRVGVREGEGEGVRVRLREGEGEVVRVKLRGRIFCCSLY